MLPFPVWNSHREGFSISMELCLKEIWVTRDSTDFPQFAVNSAVALWQDWQGLIVSYLFSEYSGTHKGVQPLPPPGSLLGWVDCVPEDPLWPHWKTLLIPVITALHHRSKVKIIVKGLAVFSLPLQLNILEKVALANHQNLSEFYILATQLGELQGKQMAESKATWTLSNLLLMHSPDHCDGSEKHWVRGTLWITALCKAWKIPVYPPLYSLAWHNTAWKQKQDMPDLVHLKY